MTVVMLKDKIDPKGVTPPRTGGRWNRERKEMDWDELDPREHFLDQFPVKATGPENIALVRVGNNLPGGHAQYHKGYLNYLAACWGDHFAAVVSPDIFWHIVLCELASVVKGDPEQYRSLFSDTDEKQEIIVVTGSLTTMPLDLLVDSLKLVLPQDPAPYLPEFSTSTDRSKHAFYAAFCDMASPYYNYSMLLCQIPAFDVRGTQEDWELAYREWSSLMDRFTKVGAPSDVMTYMHRVLAVFNMCVSRRTEKTLWEGMFGLERCGSGSEVEVTGWIQRLYKEKPSVRYPDNFPSCTSVVQYKQLNTQKEYEMRSGLFSSAVEDGFLVPDFSYVVLERKPVEAEVN